MRRVILWSAAAIAGLSAGAAHAEGPYIALKGGVYLQNKLDYDFIGLDNFFTSKYKPGIDVAGALGYDFEGIRVEVEVGYKRAGVDRFGFQVNGQPLATQSGSLVTGNSHVFTGMLNAYYDISQSRIRPYVGAGVGIADVVSDHVGYSGYGDDGIFLDKSTAAFAFQAMGGVRMAVSKHVTAGIGYRYFNVPDVGLHTFSTVVKTSLHSSSVLGTLTYTFGTPYADLPLVAVPPADAAAVLAPAPPAPPPVQTGFVISFAVGGAALSAEARGTLDQAATGFAKAGHASVMIASAAETTGPTVYNERLSARRAAATRDYLIAHGTPRDAITIQSFDSTAAATPTAHPRGSIDITFGPGSGQ